MVLYCPIQDHFAFGTRVWSTCFLCALAFRESQVFLSLSNRHVVCHSECLDECPFGPLSRSRWPHFPLYSSCLSKATLCQSRLWPQKGYVSRRSAKPYHSWLPRSWGCYSLRLAMLFGRWSMTCPVCLVNSLKKSAFCHPRFCSQEVLE